MGIDRCVLANLVTMWSLYISITRSVVLVRWSCDGTNWNNILHYLKYSLIFQVIHCLTHGLVVWNCGLWDICVDTCVLWIFLVAISFWWVKQWSRCCHCHTWPLCTWTLYWMWQEIILSNLWKNFHQPLLLSLLPNLLGNPLLQGISSLKMVLMGW